MPRRTPNPRLVKIHRTYTIDEAARTLGVHRNTVRLWIKQALPTCDRRRPILILGSHLAAFQTAKRARHRRSCALGELYCIRCREPRRPAADMADFSLVSPLVGNLTGICPVCELMMNRRVSLAKLAAIKDELDVAFQQADRHISDSAGLSLNCDFDAGSPTNANLQC